MKGLVIGLGMVLILVGVSWSQPIEEPPMNIAGANAFRDVRQRDANIPP